MDRVLAHPSVDTLLLVSAESVPKVAQRVLAAGFRRENFAFTQLQARQIITALDFSHHPDHYYRFEFYPGDLWAVNYSPAEHTSSSGEISVGDWSNVLTRVDWWLSYIKRELDVTDRWAAFAELSTPFTIGNGGTEDEPFSKSEKAEVLARIEQVKSYLLRKVVSRPACCR